MQLDSSQHLYLKLAAISRCFWVFIQITTISKKGRNKISLVQTISRLSQEFIIGKKKKILRKKSPSATKTPGSINTSSILQKNKSKKSKVQWNVVRNQERISLTVAYLVPSFEHISSDTINDQLKLKQNTKRNRRSKKKMLLCALCLEEEDFFRLDETRDYLRIFLESFP